MHCASRERSLKRAKAWNGGRVLGVQLESEAQGVLVAKMRTVWMETIMRNNAVTCWQACAESVLCFAHDGIEQNQAAAVRASLAPPRASRAKPTIAGMETPGAAGAASI